MSLRTNRKTRTTTRTMTEYLVPRFIVPPPSVPRIASLFSQHPKEPLSATSSGAHRLVPRFYSSLVHPVFQFPFCSLVLAACNLSAFVDTSLLLQAFVTVPSNGCGRGTPIKNLSSKLNPLCSLVPPPSSLATKARSQQLYDYDGHLHTSRRD